MRRFDRLGLTIAGKTLPARADGPVDMVIAAYAAIPAATAGSGAHLSITIAANISDGEAFP